MLRRRLSGRRNAGLRGVVPVAFVSLAAVTLIELHGAEGQRFLLNPAQITTIREPSAADLRQHFAPGAHCIVVTTSGKFLAVRESCDQVQAAVSKVP